MMRLQSLRESLVLFILFALTTFLFFDEEPVFDFSDWNLIHVAMFTLAAVSICFDLTMRSRYGQFVHKDQSALCATLTFWFWLENYFRAVVIIFSFHSLTPLEAELFELVEVYNLMAVWISCEILPCLMMLGLIFTLAHCANTLLGWARWSLVLYIYMAIALLLTWSLLAMLWDLALVGLSSFFAESAPAGFYNQAKTSLLYNHQSKVNERFDWHKEASQVFTMRFEGLFFFSLQLLICVTLYAALVTWLWLVLDVLQTPQRVSSYTQLAVAMLWLEHLFYALMSSLLLFGLVGARITLRCPWEFWWF